MLEEEDKEDEETSVNLVVCLDEAHKDNREDDKEDAEILQTHPGLRWKMKSGVRESALKHLR